MSKRRGGAPAAAAGKTPCAGSYQRAQAPICAICKFFGLSEGYFLRLQNAYDTLEAKRRIAKKVAKIKPYKPSKAA